ncbi:MAG: TIGR02221 family CRISPR-associated protein [Bacteroidaceae bacterium]|nr:TIGR02221 family CRISPR-associated protein [Bacteroidaceae bacterium]
MSRKVFISFLGYSKYSPCFYCKDSYKSQCVSYIQEATIEYINTLSQWTDNDVALILLTKGAEMKNWVDNGHVDFRTKETIAGEGLQSRLKGMGLPLRIKPIKELPDGNNENEIWEIFSRVYEELLDGDEVYFDLTHGFRYLPMLALVLGNYAKFLKRITVRHLSYGNFEGRNTDTNEAQIIDLMPLTNLQDWTFAAASFLENGNVSPLAKLSESTYLPLLKASKGHDESAKALRNFTESLKECVEDFQTCRGLNIERGKNINSLKDSIKQVEENVIIPLKPVVKQIDSAIEPFDPKENIDNGFHAAQWCLDNGLYQQAATILQENVVSFFSDRHDIAIDDEKGRHLINSAFAILFNNLQEDEEEWQVADEDKDKIREILSDELIRNKDVFNTFNNLSEVRNDINHSGMRSTRLPLSAKKIRSNIDKCVTLFNSLLISNYVH